MSDYTNISVGMMLIHKSDVFKLQTETKPDMSDPHFFSMLLMQ